MKRMMATWMTALAALLLAGTAGAGNVYYVALDATGANNGTDWANAFTTLHAAIAASVDGDAILVKQGTYGITSQLHIGTGTNLTIRGGYAGSGTPGDRSTDPALTLVERTAGDTRLLRIDGAGGWIEGLTFRGGSTTNNGGGVYLDNASTVFTNCVIRDNATTGSRIADPYSGGGGAYIARGNPVFAACVFRDNVSERTGGGVYIADGAPQFLSCVVRESVAKWYGAAFTMGSGADACRLFNCLIVNNATWDYRGDAAGIRLFNTLSQIENCTVSGSIPRGLMGNAGSIKNCIFWGNRLDDINGSAGKVSYSSVQSPGVSGTGVIHADPAFEMGYFVGASSLCLDAGSDTATALGLAGLYARTNNADTDQADLGYHYPTAFQIQHPDLYVDSGRPNDGGDGTSWGTAFKTLTNALARAEAGCRIHLAAGAYGVSSGESFPLVWGPDLDGVQILGTNATATVIDATGANTRVLQIRGVGPSARLSGVTLTGGNLAGSGSGLHLQQAEGIRVEQVTIRNNTITGDGHYGAGVYADLASPYLSHCVIASNQNGAGTGGGGGGGIYFGRGAAGEVRFCVIRNNRSRLYGGGVQFGNGAATPPLGPLFANCLVVSNETYGGYGSDVGGLMAWGGALRLENCTVAGNSDHGFGRDSRYPTTYTIRNSVFQNVSDLNSSILGDSALTTAANFAYNRVGVGSLNGVNGNTNADPLFVDQVYCHLQSRNRDYRGGYFAGGTWGRSGAQSPLIDAGDPGGVWANEPDYPRGLLNMGAYGNTDVASYGPPPGGTMILIR